jgi:hypothetical protein
MRKFVLKECEFRENVVSEIRVALKGHKLICMRTPHVHCPISVKFGIRALHTIAIERFVNVMEIGAMKGLTFAVFVRAVTFARVP